MNNIEQSTKSIIDGKNEIKKTLESKSDNFEDDKPLELDNLLEIEKPELRGKLVKVDAIISSNNIPYSIPTELLVECFIGSDSHSKICPGSSIIKVDDVDKPSFTEINNSQKTRVLKEIAQKNAPFNQMCKLQYTERKSTTIKRLRIRPIVSSLIKKPKGFFDNGGNEWKAYDIYVEQNEIQKLEAGKEFNFIGRVIPDSKNQRIALYIISSIESQNTNYDKNKIQQLRDFFSSKSTDEILNWLTKEFTAYSKIIGRENVTICYLLAFFSVLNFTFDTAEIIGWVKNSAIGDSTVGKSESAKKLIRLLLGGQMITGELSSKAGIGATATQGSNNTWFVDFGALVLQDRKLLIIDGAHKLKRTHWDELSEAEREGKITIMKAAKGEAYARTRSIKIMNPVGEDLVTTQTMNSFYYPVLALKNNFQIQNIARIDLAIFVIDDISPEIRNSHLNNESDEKLMNLSDLMKLVWANNFDVVFEDLATEEILKSATDLEKNFKYEEIPLISNDIKYKLARLSASLAALTCSFNDDYSQLMIKLDHVKCIVDFMKIEYQNAGLDKLSQNVEVIDTEEVHEIIIQIENSLSKIEPPKTNEECKSIVSWMAQQPKFTKDLLSGQFDIPQNNGIRSLTAMLQNSKLVKSTNRGFVPTKRLIQLGKLLNTSNIPKNDTTNSNHSTKEGDTIFGGVSHVRQDKQESVNTPNTSNIPKNDIPPLEIKEDQAQNMDNFGCADDSSNSIQPNQQNDQKNDDSRHKNDNGRSDSDKPVISENTDDSLYSHWACPVCHQDNPELFEMEKSDRDGKNIEYHRRAGHDVKQFTKTEADELL